MEFDFVSWDGANASDDIYVHVWGLVDNSASGTASIANLGAQNGNMWANAVTNGFSVTNLGDGSLMTAGGDGVASGAAIQLLDQDTGNSLLANAIHVRRTFDLSAYAVNTLAGYDYLVIGFSRNPVAGDNKFALFDVAVSVDRRAQYVSGRADLYRGGTNQSLSLKFAGIPEHDCGEYRFRRIVPLGRTL